MTRLDASFFRRDPVVCARDLIGTRFVWHGCEGRIVETEAYAAEGDPACHTFFRPSARLFVESHDAGAAYVYLNYGVHWLFNVLVKGPGGAGFVLFRALEPLGGVERMVARRGRPRLGDLCSGPGKLTRALGIDGAAHGLEFLQDPATGLFRGAARELAAGPRIGISRGRDFPWRFLESGNRHVSKPGAG
jgi:DNA-3-methyladenine glycosylase